MGSEEKMSDEALLAGLGATYFQSGDRAVYEARENNLYSYRCFIGANGLCVASGDMAYLLGSDKCSVHRVRGPTNIRSDHFAVGIRGYTPDSMSRNLESGTILPYVNGCHTKQLFPPERLGDPTLQLLTIPPYSAEQAHHIHSTVRCVYVLSGRGISEVGMEGKSVRTELLPGMVCILEPMCPHHFETPQGESLTVLPVHVWSSSGAGEFNHPMFLGTHMMNHGA